MLTIIKADEHRDTGAVWRRGGRLLQLDSGHRGAGQGRLVHGRPRRPPEHRGQHPPTPPWPRAPPPALPTHVRQRHGDPSIHRLFQFLNQSILI